MLARAMRTPICLVVLSVAAACAQPGGYRLSVECCSDPADACSCSTVAMLCGASWATPLYAFVRDAYGNYVSPSTGIRWETRSGAVSLAVDPDTAHKVVLTGAPTGGVTWVVGTDTAQASSDSVQVTVTPSSVIRKPVAVSDPTVSRLGSPSYNLQGRRLWFAPGRWAASICATCGGAGVLLILQAAEAKR